jgi:L-malate glycosyltransferase
LLRIPIVYHYHMKTAAPSSFARFASEIIAVSDYVKVTAENRGRPIRTIHNVVDMTRFATGKDIRAQLGIPGNSTVVTFVGQIKLIKGILTFMRAIGRIADPAARFVIAGEFCEQSEVLTLNMFEDAVRADDRVMYLGYRNDIQDLYMSSDIIVMPSLIEEAFGMVLLEAAAARKPVVAAAIGGTPEVIRDGVNGYLVARDDDAELAVRIDQLIHSDGLRKEMGARAFGMALDNFSDRPIKKLEMLYEELVRA